MIAQTPSEINAEINALEACKSYVPRFSFFGDDNHKGIDLQIEALRGEIDVTADEWNDFSTDEQTLILDAMNWQEGGVDESPSSGWNYLKPKAAKSGA